MPTPPPLSPPVRRPFASATAAPAQSPDDSRGSTSLRMTVAVVDCDRENPSAIDTPHARSSAATAISTPWVPSCESFAAWSAQVWPLAPSNEGT